uniref:Uncharacterized protein n=1 Tax=Molossus molossus TaxID=27622 RepID=A0A7J8ERJ0_MOLMO|nr:hypothetical protein HJG59_008652 [Molossus molossus]
MDPVSAPNQLPDHTSHSGAHLRGGGGVLGGLEVGRMLGHGVNCCGAASVSSGWRGRRGPWVRRSPGCWPCLFAAVLPCESRARGLSPSWGDALLLLSWSVLGRPFSVLAQSQAFRRLPSLVWSAVVRGRGGHLWTSGLLPVPHGRRACSVACAPRTPRPFRRPFLWGSHGDALRSLPRASQTGGGASGRRWPRPRSPVGAFASCRWLSCGPVCFVCKRCASARASCDLIYLVPRACPALSRHFTASPLQRWRSEMQGARSPRMNTEAREGGPSDCLGVLVWAPGFRGRGWQSQVPSQGPQIGLGLRAAPCSWL